MYNSSSIESLGPCRDIYASCERWQTEAKCELVRTQTNFFDVNCAVSCQVCTPDVTISKVLVMTFVVVVVIIIQN
jgi:hypothetical protein